MNSDTYDHLATIAFGCPVGNSPSTYYAMIISQS